MQRVVHFLVHVPKCAGTTVEAHFRTHLGEGFLRAPRWHSPLRPFIGNRYAIPAGDPRLAKLKAVTGHSMGVSLKRHFPGCEIRESVLLRDPVGYHLSLYNYRIARHRAGTGPEPPGFALWYRAQRRNPISRFLLNHYFEQGIPMLYRLSSRARLAWLEARLRDFWFVGSYRRAEELIAGLGQEFGITMQAARQNVGAVQEITESTLDQAMQRRIVEENAVDQALWSRWADRGWRADNLDPVSAPPSLPGYDQLASLGSDVATLGLRTVLKLRRG